MPDSAQHAALWSASVGAWRRTGGSSQKHRPATPSSSHARVPVAARARHAMYYPQRRWPWTPAPARPPSRAAVAVAGGGHMSGLLLHEGPPKRAGAGFGTLNRRGRNRSMSCVLWLRPCSGPRPWRHAALAGWLAGWRAGGLVSGLTGPTGLAWPGLASQHLTSPRPARRPASAHPPTHHSSPSPRLLLTLPPLPPSLVRPSACPCALSAPPPSHSSSALRPSALVCPALASCLRDDQSFHHCTLTPRARSFAGIRRAMTA